MTDVELRLKNIEKKIDRIIEIISIEKSYIETKWVSEQWAMEILNLTARGIEEIRRKNVSRTSSATGRNFLYYMPDIERYIYDNSTVGNPKKKGGQSKKD